MSAYPTDRTDVHLAPVLEFLLCRTPEAWVSAAVQDIPILLLDHASLELKAAQQAQRLIRKYGTVSVEGVPELGLPGKMSRLAREELRHFEQVIAILGKRGVAYRPVSASRYARALHSHVRPEEPGRLVDTLIVGAIIEARSCERFFCLRSRLESEDPELARFYESLLQSEARHFRDYLALGEAVARGPISDRVQMFLQRERALVLEPDPQIRFHSGLPLMRHLGG